MSASPLPPAARDDGLSKNLEIEVLRCVAIVFTLLQHVHVLVPDSTAWMALLGKRLGFWTGVDLFFVVSGFVIMCSLRPLLARRERGEPVRRELLAFWVKRVFRLLPTAWFWLLVPLGLSPLLAGIGLMPPVEMMWRGVLSAMLNVENLVAGWCMIEPREAAVCSSRLMSGHYWSLSLEEQFYIVLPLLLVLLPRRSLLPLALAGILACVFIARPVFSLVWFLRVDGFLWGIVLALLLGTALHARLEPRLLASLPLRLVCTALLVFALARVPVVWAGLGLDFAAPHRTYAMAGIAFTGALMVWIASYDRGYLFGRNGRLLRPFVYVGARSYSIYVIHLPVFLVLHFMASKLPPQSSLLLFNTGLTALAVGLTLVLSELNFRLIETPLRDRGRGIAARLRRPAPGLGKPATI